MDDQAVIRTYGHMNLPEGTANRPLVTFALFAYNQEKYIREAVEGAFSQTYSPLEIILSDDCSSDRTFEIMDEMAQDYQGPHLVKVRKGDRNVGVLAHVLHVAKIADGKLFVVAAGDDISLPSRTSQIVQALSGTNYLALSSDDIIINEKSVECEWDKERFEARRSWHAANPAWVHGASAAYSTAFLKSLPIPNTAIFYEDMVFGDLMQILAARTVRLDERLVKYRYHFDNLSNRRQASFGPENIERLSIERWRRARDAKMYCIEYLENAPNSLQISPGAAKRIKIQHGYLSRIANWQTATPTDRLQLLCFAIRTGNLKFALPRLLGKRAHFALRRLMRV